MGDDNKVRSVKVKRVDGSLQIHSIKLLDPLELFLTHAYHPGTVPSSEAAVTRESTTLMSPKKVHMLIVIPISFQNASKGIKISRENVAPPITNKLNKKKYFKRLMS